ncbi:MAG: chemotaxis protein CheW [Deltaproteobacteria bacterium]|nr:chemotaxis protein CheW [Deltaproteobacteria bacterium]
MKNVVVLVLGGERHAVELRWVREIVTLGPVTPVPTAPPVIAGAVNVAGVIMPVLNGPSLLEESLGHSFPRGRPPHAGDTAVVFDVVDTRAALAVERIDAVTTLSQDDGGALVTADGQVIPLLDPPTLLATARKLVVRAAAAEAPHEDHGSRA